MALACSRAMHARQRCTTWFPFMSRISSMQLQRIAAEIADTCSAVSAVSTIFCTTRVPCTLSAMASSSSAAMAMSFVRCSVTPYCSSFCTR